MVGEAQSAREVSEFVKLLLTAAAPVAAAAVTAALPMLLRNPSSVAQQDAELSLKRIETLEKALSAAEKAKGGPHGAEAAAIVRQVLRDLDEPARHARETLRRYISMTWAVMLLGPVVPSISTPPAAARTLALTRRHLLLLPIALWGAGTYLGWPENLIPFVGAYWLIFTVSGHRVAKTVARRALEDLVEERAGTCAAPPQLASTTVGPGP